MTGIDPVMLTEYAVIFSVVALPLTYLPILLVANDQAYMGRHANGRLANVFGVVYLVVIMVVALAAIPLMILTNRGRDERDRVDLALGLLDHQLLDCDGRRCGNVDDLELDSRRGPAAGRGDPRRPAGLARAAACSAGCSRALGAADRARARGRRSRRSTRRSTSARPRTSTGSAAATTALRPLIERIPGS